MRALSLTAGALGLLLLVFAAAGRFVGQPTITMLGQTFRAGTFLLLGDTALLVGIFLYLMSMDATR